MKQIPSNAKRPLIRGGIIGRIPRQYPNLCCDMSADSCHTALSRDPEYTRRLNMTFPERFVYVHDYFDNIYQELITSLDCPATTSHTLSRQCRTTECENKAC